MTQALMIIQSDLKKVLDEVIDILEGSPDKHKPSTIVPSNFGVSNPPIQIALRILKNKQNEEVLFPEGISRIINACIEQYLNAKDEKYEIKELPQYQARYSTCAQLESRVDAIVAIGKSLKKALSEHLEELTAFQKYIDEENQELANLDAKMSAASVITPAVTSGTPKHTKFSRGDNFSKTNKDLDTQENYIEEQEIVEEQDIDWAFWLSGSDAFNIYGAVLLAASVIVAGIVAAGMLPVGLGTTAALGFGGMSVFCFFKADMEENALDEDSFGMYEENSRRV